MRISTLSKASNESHSETHSAFPLGTRFRVTIGVCLQTDVAYLLGRSGSRIVE